MIRHPESSLGQNIIHFSFGLHNREAVTPSLLDKLEAKIKSVFSVDPNIKNIFFEEVLGRTVRAVELTNTYRARGYPVGKAGLAAYLLLAEGSEPEETRLDEAILKFSERLQKGDINDEDFAFTAAVDQVLDKIAGEGVNFELDAEATDDEQQAQELIREATITSSRALRVLPDGIVEGKDINFILDTAREDLRAFGHIQNTRNTIITKRLVDRLKRSQRPQRIFVRVGEAHTPLVELVTESLGSLPEDTLIESSFDYMKPLNDYWQRVGIALQRNPELFLSDEMVIRSIVSKLLYFHTYRLGKNPPERYGINEIVMANSTEAELRDLVTNLREFESQKLTQFIRAKILT